MFVETRYLLFTKTFYTLQEQILSTTLSILMFYSPNFQGLILMKNSLTHQVGMLGDIFLRLVANSKQWPFTQLNRLVAMINWHVCIIRKIQPKKYFQSICEVWLMPKRNFYFISQKNYINYPKFAFGSSPFRHGSNL